jgi:hypothetical protein
MEQVLPHVLENREEYFLAFCLPHFLMPSSLGGKIMP